MSAFERQTLSNGVRVLTAPMPQAQSVTCSLMLAAGSRYETPETNGIAHFAEHMFFKGTERRPTARQIAGEIDAIGGEFNAFTGKEYTGYYVKCAADYRDVALDVLVDMVRHSRFASEVGARVKLHTKASDQAHICLGVRSYPLEHPDRYALQLLATVLGGGMSSRLFSEVRERRGLAYYVFGVNHSYTDAGSLYSQAGVDLNRIDEALTTIATELKGMADRVPADELEKARSFSKGRFV